MRTVEFKMERPGLVSAGDKVKIIEREGTSSYSYIIDPAVAMSGCYPNSQRIKAKEGKASKGKEPKASRKLYFKAGGGITSKSDCRREYEEVIQKIYLPF